MPTAPAGTLPSLSRPRFATAEVPGRVPFLLVLFMLTLVFPASAAINIGPLVLTPLKFYALVMFIPAVILFAIRCRPLWADFLFFGFNLWTGMCLVLNYGAPGIELAGLIVVQTIGVYCLARATLTRIADMQALVRMWLVIIFVLGIFAVPEAILKQRLIPDFFETFTGVAQYTQDDVRMGLLRATSVFEHQILFGIFCGTMISFVIYQAKTDLGAVVRVAMCAVGLIMSLSTAPWLVLVLQSLLVTVEKYTRHIINRGRKFVWAIAGMYVFIEIASNRGAFGLVSSYLAMNPHTGYYRKLIWEHATDDILRNPIFGMRPEEWTRLHWMVPSVDNFWLVQAMRGGIPAVLMLIIGVFLIYRLLFKNPDKSYRPGFNALRRGWLYSIIALAVAGGTVAMFGKMDAVLSLLIGMGAALAAMSQTAEARLPPDTAAAPRTPGRRRTIMG